MASVIDIVIRAKNEAGQKLAQFEREVNSWAGNIGKKTRFLRDSFAAISVGVLAAGAGIAGAVSKTLGAYMDSEKAVNKLREAHRAWGDEIEQNIKRETAFADAMMRRYQVEDDAVISVMAELRMLGMRTESLQDGAKAAIAFAGADGDLEDAARLVVLAYQGNYERLARMIPALKNATNETEKAAIVNQFIAAKLQVQAGQVDTLSGAWKGFKLAVGEAVENAGRKLAADGTIQKGIEQITKIIDDASEAFGRWADQGGVLYTFSTILGTMEQIRRKAWDIANIVMVIKLAATTESTMDTLKERKAKGVPLNKAQEGVLRDDEAYWREMANRAMSDKFIADLQKEPVKRPPVQKREDKAPIAGADPGIALRAKSSAAAIASARAVAAEQQKAEQSRYEAERNNIERRTSYEQGAQSEVINMRVKLELDAAKTVHDARMKAISDEAAAKFDANPAGNESAIKAGKAEIDATRIDTGKGGIESAIKAGKAEIDAAEKAGDAREKAHENVMAMIAKLRGEEKQIAEDIAEEAGKEKKDKAKAAATKALDAQEAAAKGKIEAVDKMSDERKTLSEGPRAFKARIKEEQAAERKKRDDELRYQRLKAAERKPGLKLSQEDKAFMADFEAVKAAEKAKVDLKTIEEKRLKLQQDATTAMKKLLIEQKNVNTALQQLLVLRG